MKLLGHLSNFSFTPISRLHFQKIRNTEIDDVKSTNAAAIAAIPVHEIIRLLVTGKEI